MLEFAGAVKRFGPMAALDECSIAARLYATVFGALGASCRGLRTRRA